jgi:Tol biopolymer transport system component
MMILIKNREARISCLCLVLSMLAFTTVAHESSQEPERISVEQINQTIVDHAHWSPDQEYFAVSSNFSGHWQIYKLHRKTGAMTRLIHTNTNADFPVFSPDGQQIVFGIEEGETSNIWLVNADGSKLRQLTNSQGKQNIHPFWSADGKRLLFNSNRKNKDGFALYSMNADGSDQTILSDPNELRTFASWSPDGKKILFVKWWNDWENRDVYVMNSDGSNEINLSKNVDAKDGWPTWFPDGKNVVFASDRDGHYQIYSADVEGNGVKKLIDSPHSDVRAFVSPDGKLISFDRGVGTSRDIYTYRLKGTPKN